MKLKERLKASEAWLKEEKEGKSVSSVVTTTGLLAAKKIDQESVDKRGT